MKALITAIIPTYKRPQWLKRSVKSVLRQSFADFEILIADNASGEETDAVTQAFMQQDKRIKLLKHSTNIGAIANFQAALMQVSTPYVCFLPDDDFFAPFFFAETVPLFNSHPDIAFCGGGGVKVDKHYAVSSITPNHPFIPPSGYYAPPHGLFAYLRSSFAISFPSLLFRTDLLKVIGGFDLKIRNGADEHLISQCAARYPVYLITDRPFYFGFQHSGSLSAQTDYPLFISEADHLHENLLTTPLAQHEKEEVDRFFLKRKKKILSNAHRHFCTLKQFQEAHAYADKIYTLNPSSTWRRKRLQASLYYYFPQLASLYNQGRAIEKWLRRGRPKKGHTDQDPAPIPHPEAHFLQDYARSLDDTYTKR